MQANILFITNREHKLFASALELIQQDLLPCFSFCAPAWQEMIAAILSGQTDTYSKSVEGFYEIKHMNMNSVFVISAALAGLMF